MIFWREISTHIKTFKFKFSATFFSDLGTSKILPHILTSSDISSCLPWNAHQPRKSIVGCSFSAWSWLTFHAHNGNYQSDVYHVSFEIHLNTIYYIVSRTKFLYFFFFNFSSVILVSPVSLVRFHWDQAMFARDGNESKSQFVKGGFSHQNE